MNFIQRFLGKKPDPTENWPIGATAVPAFDTTQMQLGNITFGDPIEKARFLGRPDSTEWLNNDSLKLLYLSSGLQLDFEQGQLNYVAFLINRDALSSDHLTWQYSSPKVLCDGGFQYTLDHLTNKNDIITIWGEPTWVDSDDEETILHYQKETVVMEFEFYPNDHTLKRWNIYIE